MPRRDQVKITYGPARYDSPKAVRKQIEDAKQETQESTIQEITNNPILEIGGAQAKAGVSVLTYDAGTNVGSGIDGDGITYIFENGTNTYLSNGDEVVLVGDGDGGWIAIGVTQRTGQLIPVDQPIGFLDPTFPIVTYDPTNTGQLPLEILGFARDNYVNPSSGTTQERLSGNSRGLGYDVAGVYGAGSDLIYGMDEAGGGGSINGFSRTTSTNVALFPEHESLQAMQPNGRAVSWSEYGSNLAYRMPGDPGWTSESGVTGTTTVTKWCFDDATGAVWGFKAIAQPSPTPDTIEVYRLLPTDATIQSVGDMGIVPTTTSVTLMTPSAGNGFVTFMYRDSLASQHRYYVKAAGDTSNFTNCGTFSAASFNPGFSDSNVNFAQQRKMAVSALGETSYIYRDSGTGTLHIRMIDQTAVIYDNDTGIPVPTSMVHAHTHLSSGLVAIVATLLTTDLGDTNPNRITAALATYNYSTTVYQYYDINKWSPTTGVVGTSTLTLFIPHSGLQEVNLGEVRYIWGNTLGGTGAGGTTLYAEIVGVSGL